MVVFAVVVVGLGLMGALTTAVLLTSDGYGKVPTDSRLLAD